MPLSTNARNAMLDALTALMNGGSLQLATDGTFATILATFTLPNPAFGASSNGVATANAIANVNAAASGNAEAWRVRNSSNTVVWDRSDAGAVSESGGGGAIVLNQASTAIVSGQTVSIGSFTITQPAGT